MFVANKNVAYIKGFKVITPGSFKNDKGEEIPYDGYNQVLLSLMSKNDELVDVKCRIPNTTEGEKMYLSLKTLPLMTKILVNVEIQIAKSGSAKYFITGYEVSK